MVPLQNRGILDEQPELPALCQASPAEVMDIAFPQATPEKFSHVLAARHLSGKPPECINIPGVY